MANSFDGFYIGHVSRLQNTKADALAMLEATLALPIDATYHLTVTARPSSARSMRWKLIKSM